MRQVLIDSGFATPMFTRLHPRTCSDAELRTAAADWPLVCIRLERPLCGAGGPGDLRWVWPLAGGLLLGALWRWRRRS